MLTLYHSPQSRSSRVVWLLEEIGQPYEIRYVTIRRQDGSGGADPSNPHPDGKVPALTHDGKLITETGAICLYLTDLFPQAGVGASVGEPLRAEYLRWLFYYVGVIEPVMFVKFAQSQGPVGIDPRAAWGSPELAENAIIDALTAGPFILGERFSAIDVLLGSAGHWMRSFLPAGAAVDAYLDRLKQRPALARAMGKDSPPA